jgi:Glycosyltransferases involved in cell wall biogenesis
MPEKPSLTIVCPVYNEEQVIAQFTARLLEVVDGLQNRYLSDVLFVVDRSTDHTLEILKQLAANDSRIRILSLSSRFGHQMSLLAGIDYCRSDVLVMMDSDLQHPPELISLLLGQYEAGHDIVYTIRQTSDDVGFLRRAASSLFYKALNRLSDVPIEPNAADFRLVSRKVVRVFQESIRERNQFLRGLFGWVGFKTTALTFQAGKRAAGRSKYSLPRLLHFAFSGLLSFSKTPLKAAVVLGLLFAGAGLLMAVITTIQFFFFGKLPSGWATIVTLISGFSGIQLIFMGVIGLYVGAIYDEVKGRPHYIVDEAVNIVTRP